MATEPNATATEQVAALDQAQTQVRSEVAAGKSPTEVRVPDPSKPDGYQVFRAESPEQLIQTLAEAKANSNRYINDELKPLREQVAVLTSRLQPFLQPAQPSGDAAFSKGRYFDLLENDPVEASRYLRRYDPEYQEQMRSMEATRLRDTGTVFMSRHPEFSSAPEDADKLIKNAVGLMKQINPSISDDVLANRITPDILDAAYSLSVSRGEFKAVQPAPATRPGSPLPPPHLPSSAPPIDSASAAIAEQILNAQSESEHQDILRRNNLIR